LGISYEQIRAKGIEVQARRRTRLSVAASHPFDGMTEEDLGAIYEFLKTIKPVANQVVRFSANK
jgi:hypothetical protein